MDVLRPRFQAAFPGGFDLRNHKDAHLDLHYKGATAGLSVDLAAKLDLHLPDPIKLTWTKLLDLAGTAAREIDPHVKMLVHHPEKSGSLAALLTCPPELARVTAADGRRWIELLPSPAAVGFGELARHAIGAVGTKWTIRQHRQVAEALAKIARGMEPDPEDGTEHLADNTVVYTFKGANASSPRTREFKTASAAASLVAGIAAATAPTELVESSWLQRLPSRLALSRDETVRLGARLAWLRGSGFSLAKIKPFLTEATREEREFCAWSATVAAGATGTIGKTQVAMLEAIYDTLGVPRGSLYAGLHAGLGAATVTTDGPVDVAEAVPEILHPVPRPPAAVPVAHAKDKLASVRAETERVSALLANVFKGGEEPAPATPQAAQEGPLAGLDAEHSGLVRQLLHRAEWSRAEFDAAAVATGLMPGGAMEAINEWAFDRHGEGLLEDGDPVLVNAALLQGEAEAVAAAE